MASKEALYEEIRKKWRDDKFPGYYAGPKKLLQELKKIGIKATYHDVVTALSKIPSYFELVRLST